MSELRHRPAPGGTWLWVAASLVGITGGVANYLLATAAAAHTEVAGVGAAALVSAVLDLGCWLVLGLLWLALLVPLRGGHGWARIALTATAGLGVLLDLMNLFGSWATIATAVVQLVLLAAALVRLHRAVRPASL
jgi:hypothetical protein